MIRIAVIGVGRWGKHFVRLFRNRRGSELRWVVDPDARRLDEVRASAPEIRCTSDAEEALADPGLDAVVVAAPTSAHYRLTRAALLAGKHVLVEKPITTSSREAEDLCEKAQRHGRVLMVGHVFLYNQAVQRAKRIIDGGRLGRIRYVTMVRSNFGPIRADVSVLWDLAAHDLSIANYWLGAVPSSVVAVGGAWIEPGREDAVFATLTYPDGVLVQAQLSWLHARKAREVVVVGERGMLVFDDANREAPLRFHAAPGGGGDHDVDGSGGFPETACNAAGEQAGTREPLEIECDHFLECVEQGTRPLSDGRSAVAVVRTLEAIERSVRSADRHRAVAAQPGIPLVDLRLQHRELAGEIAQGIDAVIERASFILGEEVGEFEQAYAAYVGAKHCIAVASGTDAIELMLRAAGIGQGDEVVVPTNTFIATALAVVRAGATPVLVDCDPLYGLVDPGQVARCIGPRTKAIVAVHLYGQVAPMEALHQIAQLHGIRVFEDAAQAQGARRHCVAAGTLGCAAATSFYPGKNLGAYGDAGAVLTGSDEIAHAVRSLRNYGSEGKHNHTRLGFNSRLDTLQAVVLRAKLARLSEWNDARRRAASFYDHLLGGSAGIALPATAPGNEHVFHQYVVRVPERDKVLRSLNAVGIGAAVHYPVPIHRQGAFRPLRSSKARFPVAEQLAAEVLSLPIFPEITREQQQRVAEELLSAL